MNQPTTWGTFEEAAEASRHADGIGFVFTDDDPYTGVDLDDCYENGVLHAGAAAIVECLDSYAEWSPSGIGAHVILCADLARSQPNKLAETPWGGGFEIYCTGRFFCMTGDQLPAAPTEVENRQEELDALLADLFSRQSDVGEKRSTLVDLLRDPPGPGGRNNWLTQVAGHYARWLLDRAAFEYHVRKAAALLRDPLPETEVQTVIQSIWGAENRGFESAVFKRLKELRVREEARTRLRTEQAGERFSFPEVGWGLTDELALPVNEITYRIESLQTVGGNVLLVASYKAGKTILTMNLARSLADDEPFLNKFNVEPVNGRIAIFNYELTQEMWNRWARDLNFSNPDQVVVVHLRGGGITPIWESEYQARLVDWMRGNEVKYWIIDPTAVAWQGLVDHEGNNVLAAEFTAAVDAVKKRAGVEEAVITHHTGRYEQHEDNERARGATRLEDWMDVGWYLTKKGEQRFLRGNGRDVSQEPLALSYDAETRRVSTVGLTKSELWTQKGVERVVDAIVHLEERGVTMPDTRTLKEAIQGTTKFKPGWIKDAEAQGLVRRKADGKKVLRSLTQMGRSNYTKRHQQ